MLTLLLYKITYLPLNDYILPGSFVENPITTIDDPAAQPFLVAPNPSTGVFHITFSNSIETSIQVFSTQGKEIRSLKSSDKTVRVDLSEQPTGVYSINIIHEKGL